MDIKELAKELCKEHCHHLCNDTTDCVVEDEAKEVIANSATTTEKQIEEMAKVIFESSPLPEMWMSHARISAEVLYNEGYRKQSEGEWIYHECVCSDDGLVSGYSCSCCGASIFDEIFEDTSFPNKFCSNCGAKMKGGEE